MDLPLVTTEEAHRKT